MEATPRISVVIPAYNAGATIADAVATARAQSLRPAEIVVVDDASTDDTVTRLEALGGDDLVVIQSPVNRGGAAARNRGVEAARGELVAFLDADDLWAADKLARQVAVLGTRELAFCFTALTQTNEYGERRTLPRRAPRPGESLADYILKAGHVVQTSTLLVPRRLCAECAFDESLRRFQDIDFALKLEQRAARPVFVAQPLVEWRSIDAGQRVSATHRPELIRAFLAVHGARLTAAQRLGLELRSEPPGRGAVGTLRWLGRLSTSVALGAVPPANAASLLLKRGLGTERYGKLRQWSRGLAG